MFDGSVPGIGQLAGLPDAAVIDAAAGWARAEAAAAARKLAAMAELFARRTGATAEERDRWWVDPDAAAGAELAAAVNISRLLALHQAHRGTVLREQLPKVGALFAAGVISDELVRVIVYRTGMITDPAVWAAVDAALAARVARWGPWSRTKIETCIDALIEAHDPGGLRRTHQGNAEPTVEFGSPTDAPGMTSLWARLYAHDAAVIEARVNEMAASVCDGDPRSLDQRRVAALAALAAGTDFGCHCGHPDCPTPLASAPPNNTVVYLITDHHPTQSDGDTGPGQPDTDPSDGPDLGHDPEVDGDAPGTGSAAADPAGDAGSELTDTADGPAGAAATGQDSDTLDSAAEPASAADGSATAAGGSAASSAQYRGAARCGGGPAGYLFGRGVVPTPLLGALMDGARVREVAHPGAASVPEPRYCPSRRLADFVRCRDVTCRFPGCDQPATECDIDHTVAFPVGPTHPSNLKCLCRFHHMLKTFWGGRTGWRDKQLPDGTVIWTAPTGHTYLTHPGSLLLYPRLCAPTAALWRGDPPVIEEHPLRGLKMPRRRRTRAQDRAARIRAERKLNDPRVAEHNKPPPF